MHKALKAFRELQVHRARKALKRARAALRLLREGLDAAAFRAENAALRDAGRSLAPLRDVKAVLGALDELRARYPEEMRRFDLQKLKDSLKNEQGRTRRDVLESGAARLHEQVLPRLRGESGDCELVHCLVSSAGVR